MNLTEALEIIESGNPFTCKVVSYDKKRGTGGKIHVYECISDRQQHERSTVVPTKAQNHFDNATRNVTILADGHRTSVPRKLHIDLLLEVNGVKVML